LFDDPTVQLDRWLDDWFEYVEEDTPGQVERLIL